MRIRPALAALLAAGAALSGAGCAAVPCGDPPPLSDLKDPGKVLPTLQEFIRCGAFAKAFDACLTPETRKMLGYERFYMALTAYEAGRRLIVTSRAHGIDVAGERLRLCNPEYGVARDLRLRRITLGRASWFALELTHDDLEYLKGKAFEWHRHQVRRADGWHFAYPPDWVPAPVARTCNCGRTA
jgi:hypothetical protein